MKKKICSSCNQETFLFKSSPKLCKSCYQKSYNKPIKKVSDRHKETLKEYKVIREEFLKNNPNCQLRLQGCTFVATDIHHTFSGKDKQKYFLDIKTWKALCRNCHSILHNTLSLKENIELNMKNQINNDKI